MSRIFEAIRKAQQDRAGRARNEPAPQAPGPHSDRRRNRRWTVDVPVFVYGHSATQEPFHEEAHTLDVSANGALLMLGANVQAGQKLLLINKSTQVEQECRVVYLGEQLTRSSAVAIEFGQANAPFWQIPAR
ncbi:MAG: PilZ domain-containing protein [Candidatus Acidiferrales bacterium]